MAAVLEDGWVSIIKGTWKIRIEKVVNIPLTLGGKAVFMIQNILPCIAAAFVQGFKVEDVRLALTPLSPHLP